MCLAEEFARMSHACREDVFSRCAFKDQACEEGAFSGGAFKDKLCGEDAEVLATMNHAGRISLKEVLQG